MINNIRMHTIKFGLNFIDQHLNDIADESVYLFSESNSTLRYFFFNHLINFNLNYGVKCLYLSNFDYLSEVDLVRKNLLNLKKHELLSILEIPLYLKQLINDSFDLNHIMNDLKLYIDSFKPGLIIVENPELFLKEENTEVETMFISQFMNFFNRISISTIIDVSNLKQKNRLICEKFTEGVFEFDNPQINNNYQLLLRNFKSFKKQLILTFTIDAYNNINPSFFKNRLSVSLDDCRHIIMKSGFKSFESYFQELIRADIRFSYYSSINDFETLSIEERFALVVIPAVTTEINGWQIISWVRRKHPLCRILFTGSVHIPASQKVRAIRMGADKVISFPFEKDELKQALEIMYYQEEDEEVQQSQHTILYSSHDFLGKYNSQIIFKKPLARFIKEYVFKVLSKGFSVHFYKVLTTKTSVDDLYDTILKNQQLIFICTYFINEKQAMLLIFDNLSLNQIKYFKQQLAINLKEVTRNNSVYISNQPINSGLVNLKINTPVYIEKDSLISEIKNISYPIDETDIDNILDWIYELE